MALLLKDKPTAVPLTSVWETTGRNGASVSPAMQGISGATVLLSDEHYKHSLGIVRHLGRMGAHVSIVAASKDSLACRSRYCHDVILSRAASLEALVETALQAVKDKHFDLVMPVSFPMTLALARQRDQFAPYTRLELAESRAIERAANKVAMMEIAAEVGVPFPKTFGPMDVQNRSHALNFPVVIKLQRESPGRSPVRYARNLKELKDALKDPWREKPSCAAEFPLIQEFIPGQGCGFFATYEKGVCKRVFMHRRVREYPATGGVSSCAESFYDSKLELYGRRMLDALGWHGVAMVEFRRDSRDGEYKLMEVNPKFWGSLDLALASGADFPGDLCRMALGRTLSFSDRYMRNLRFQWPLSGHGELFHLWTRPASVLRVALDFLNPRVKSNLWVGDLGPNIQEFRRLASQLFRMRKG